MRRRRPGQDQVAAPAASAQLGPGREGEGPVLVQVRGAEHQQVAVVVGREPRRGHLHRLAVAVATRVRVDAARHDRLGGAVAPQALRPGGPAAGVADERHPVGELEREPGDVAVGEPVVVGLEVGRVLEGDRVELVDHEPVRHPGEHVEVGQVGHLVGPVDEVDPPGVAGEVGAVQLHELDLVELGPQRRHVGRGPGRHERHEMVDAGLAGEGAQRCHRDLLGAHAVGPEAQGVDAHREPPQRPAGRAEGVGQGGRGVDLRALDPLRVPGVAAAHDRLVTGLARGHLGPGAEAGAAPVVHEHVVGAHVAEPVGDGPLAEVDLLAVAGREGLVEAADEVEGVAADVDAVADRGRDRRPQAQAAGGHPPGGFRRREARRECPPGPVAVGDRQDRAVVGERRGRGHAVGAVGGGGEALQPLRPDHDVAVDQHDVPPPAWRRTRRCTSGRTRGWSRAGARRRHGGGCPRARPARRRSAGRCRRRRRPGPRCRPACGR